MQTANDYRKAYARRKAHREFWRALVDMGAFFGALVLLAVLSFLTY